MSISRFITQVVLKHPYLNIVLITIITVIFGLAITKLTFDTSLSAFVIRNDPDMAYYNKIKEMFETDETVIIAFKARNLFNKQDLRIIKELSDEISELKFVHNVRSLTNANLIVTTPEMFEVRTLVEKLPESSEESSEIKKHATTNYLYMKDLASVDGRFASLLIDIQNVSGEKHTKEVVAAIKQILQKKTKRTSLRFYLGGDAIINDSLGEYMQRDFFIFILPSYLILTLLLLVTVGCLRDITISLITITVSLTWVMGTISLFGKSFNNVTVGLIPLILCISLEDIYYIHNAYYEHLRLIKNKYKAFKAAFAHIIRPCFFTSFTTVVGFGSLMINKVKPILDFGLVGSTAVILTFIITIILIPSIHLLLPLPKNLDKKPKFKLNPAPVITAIGQYSEKNQKKFWVIIPFILLFSLVGISRMRIETDHLTFFHKKSEVYKSVSFIESNLAGISNLEVTLSAPQAGMIKEPTILKEIEKLVGFLRKQKKVDKALSIVDFLKDMNRAMHDNQQSYYRIPDTKDAVAQYLLVYSMSSRRNDVEKDFVDYDYRLARIRCRLSEHNSRAILSLIDSIKAFVATNIDPNLSVKITSYPVIYSNMVNALASGQIKCLILVFFGLLLVTSIYFKSIKIGLLAMIPNTIPIVFTLGLMGWLGVSLNIATAMTAGIAIGLAMDDTTHFFTRFQQRYAHNPHYVKDTQQTLLSLGEPMVYSSLLMMAGYLVLLFSQFHLTVIFGLLCALTILVALLCDLFITPWILMVFKPNFNR